MYPEALLRVPKTQEIIRLFWLEETLLLLPNSTVNRAKTTSLSPVPCVYEARCSNHFISNEHPRDIPLGPIIHLALYLVGVT